MDGCLMEVRRRQRGPVPPIPTAAAASVNIGSGRLADTVGLPDLGWHIYELAEEPPPIPHRLARHGRELLSGWTGRARLALPSRSS
jgi:hypothetical protein